MRLGPTATAVVTASRVISYTYDGLARLTQATQQPGISTTDGYDLAGNRTQVKANDLIVATRMYNAANQVIGWQYDAVQPPTISTAAIASQRSPAARAPGTPPTR